MRATPSSSNARHAPTISEIESAAPDLVKMNLLDAHLVHDRFGFTKALKYRRRVGLGPGGKRGLVDHFEDVPQMPVFFGLRQPSHGT